MHRRKKLVDLRLLSFFESTLNLLKLKVFLVWVLEFGAVDEI